MDGTLPWSLFNTLEAVFSSLGNVALVVAINPWVLAAVVPVRLGLRRTYRSILEFSHTRLLSDTHF
jgi:hypothetical protein